MGAWIRGHLWQIGLGLLAMGSWVNHVEGAIEKVESLDIVAAQQAQLKWSLDSLRLEVTHMNRNVEELLRRPF